MFVGWRSSSLPGINNRILYWEAVIICFLRSRNTPWMGNLQTALEREYVPCLTSSFRCSSHVARCALRRHWGCVRTRLCETYAGDGNSPLTVSGVPGRPKTASAEAVKDVTK